MENARVFPLCDVCCEDFAEIFDLFDLTGDGKITYSEVGNLMRVLGLNVVNAQVLQFLGNPKVEEMEEKKLSLEEFVFMFKQFADGETNTYEEWEGSYVADMEENGKGTEDLYQIITANAEEVEVEEGATGVEDNSQTDYEEILSMLMN